MVGTSFAQYFGSKIMGLWPGCTEGETNFSCGIHFNIKEYPHVRIPSPLNFFDLNNKIEHRNHAKYLIPKISKVFMRSFKDEILKRNGKCYLG